MSKILSFLIKRNTYVRGWGWGVLAKKGVDPLRKAQEMRKLKIFNFIENA